MRHSRPLRPELLELAAKKIILLARPLAIEKAGDEVVSVSVAALAPGAAGNQLGDLVPVLGTVNRDELLDPLVLFVREFAAGVALDGR